VSLIEASPLDAGTAHAAIDRHANDDLKPYIFKTTDYGKSWTSITNGIPDTTFVRAVREDPKKRGLLYAGTEMGVFVSFNGGANWRPLQLNLPRAPIHDLVVKNDDLVVATHGRAFWILDDLSPVREFSDAIAQQDVHLYAPAVAYRMHNSDEPAKPILVGLNPPPGAVIDFWLKEAPKGDVTVEILDASQKVVRKYSSAKLSQPEEPLDPDDKKPEKQIKPEAGLNRFVWDLRYEGANRVPNYSLWEYKEGARGPLAMPGQYQVRLTVDGKSQTAPLELKLDPRVQVEMAELQKQFDLQLAIREQLNRVYEAVNQIEDVCEQSVGMKKRLPENDSNRAVFRAADDLEKKLISVRDPLINVKISANEDSLAYRPQLDGQLAFLSMIVGGYSDSAPTEAAVQRFAVLKTQVDQALAQWRSVQQTDVAEFQKMAAGRGYQSVVVPAAGSAVSRGENEP